MCKTFLQNFLCKSLTKNDWTLQTDKIPYKYKTQMYKYKKCKSSNYLNAIKTQKHCPKQGNSELTAGLQIYGWLTN